MLESAEEELAEEKAVEAAAPTKEAEAPEMVAGAPGNTADFRALQVF